MCQENQTHLMRVNSGAVNAIARAPPETECAKMRQQYSVALDFNSHSSFTLLEENDLCSNYSNWCINTKLDGLLQYSIALLCYLLRPFDLCAFFSLARFVSVLTASLFASKTKKKRAVSDERRNTSEAKKHQTCRGWFWGAFRNSMIDKR